jgi:hypothetical protein
MKRRREQERDEATAREQAEARREALLADLRARQSGEPEPTGEAAAAENAPADEEPAEERPTEEAPADEGEGSEALPAD